MRSRIKEEPTKLHDDAGGLLPPTGTPTPMTLRATTPVSIASTTPAPSTTDRTSRAAMSEEDTDLPSSSTVTPDNRNGDVDMLNSQATATPSAMEQIGTPARQLIQAVNRLEALNIDATLESIPKFVVIGDQSAGKSSVIEAICDIQLPRNEGTCTRCPYQISTTSSGPDGSWSCRITILNKYGYDERTRAGVNGATFNRWIEKDTDVFEFVTLHDKQELEGALCRAQLAVLNPQQNPVAYLNVPLKPGHAYKQKVGFSPNVISLEITAPNLPDLSFYDLPGAINTISDESQEFLVEFVEKLLKKYMSDEEARIVLACSANQDLEVSTTLRFLRQCKASHRTLGVLTKPDLVEFTQAKVTFFQDLLQGKQYKLGGGWFVSRQLSQTELNGKKAMTHEQAREIEAGFFSTEPWTSSLAAHAHRFGIPHLQQCISRELIDDIIRKLPNIATRVQARLSTIDEELKTIPEAVAAQTASLTVITEIDNAKTALISEINADSNQSELRKKHRQIFRDLVKRLRNLKPEAVWVSPGYKKLSIAVDDSSEDDSPSKRAKTKQGSRATSSTPRHSVRSRRTPASPDTPHPQADQIRSGKTIFRLNEVKARFDSSPGGDIPDQVNDAVVRSLILEPLSIFSNITDGVIKQIRKEFIDMVDRVVMAALSQRLATELYRQVVESAKSLFEELLQEVTDSVCRLVAATCHRPIAYNPWLPAKRSNYEIENLRIRREQRVEEHYAILEAEGHRVPNLPDQNKKAADIGWVNSNLGVDDYEREVKALATPLAYYDVASAQLVDNVAQQVECGVMAAYESRLPRRLFKDLRATEPEHCVALLAEDPAREARREQLLAERAKLEKALAELEALPVTHA